MPSQSQEDQPTPSDQSRPGCLLGLLRAVFATQPRHGPARTGRKVEPLPYRQKDYLFTKGERAFYEQLRLAINHREHVIFAKVRLLDLLWMPKGTQNRQTHHNRVQSKHVDFVLCSTDVLRPVLIIELDDRSHARPDRQDRDAFVDAACHAAGLPILHIPAAYAYDPTKLRAQIHAALTQ